jgi:tetratricopeptide (TPR) repeat protein
MTSIDQLHQAAQAAMRAGDLRGAHQNCLAILQQDQKFADAWFLCGVIAAHNGQVAKSAEILRRAIALAPTNAEYLAELGKQLVALRQPREALETARSVVALQPTKLPTLNTLGTVLSHLGEHEEALACYEQAVASLQRREKSRLSLPRDWQAELFFNHAASLNFCGQLEQAEQAYERAIELQPRLYRAHSALSLLRRQTRQHNNLQRLRSLKPLVDSPEEQLHIGHALAKELEDLGQYPESLENLHWAKEAWAKQVDYHPDQDGALFDALESGFGKSLFETALPGCDSDEPIFVVGMPRTGTTLVERILAGHSSVFAAGELQNFPLQVKRLTGTPSKEVLDVDTLLASLRLDPAALGEAYIDSTRPRTGHTDRFVDKLPLNFMYLGLIHMALPKAKLVCLRRDPMDTCLSNYRQLFATNFRYYHYSYDLLDCGSYYLRFDHLMHHWREVMPGAIHEVQYETLVAEPERCARELLAFCGLPWETQCLDFHRQKGSVATASATQVRQPIYSDAINRWRRYGDALRPLYDLLTSAGCLPPAGD